MVRTFDPSCLGHIETLRKRWGVRGLSVSLVLSPDYFGEDRWLEECYCFGESDDSGSAVSPDSVWSVGACGHAITMLSIATLIDTKVLTLRGDPITYYSKMKDLLADWQLQDEYATDHMDLVDVMEHRTGLPRHHLSRRPTETPAELIKRLRHLRPSCEPRYDFQFSEIHYDILQKVVTTLTGIPFAKYVNQQFFDPLDFQQSYYGSKTAGELGNPVAGSTRAEYEQRKMLDTWRDEHRLETCLLGEAKELETPPAVDVGGLMMSGRDMWARAFMDSPLIASLWQRTTLKASYNYPMMFRQSNLHHEELGAWSYGLGMGISTYRGNYTGGDQGSVPGQATRFARLPNEGAHIFIAVDDGTHGELITDLVTYYLYDILLGLEPLDWEAKYLDRMVATLPVPVLSPKELQLVAPEEDLGGVYNDNGYGRLELRRCDPLNDSFEDTRIIHAIRRHLERTISQEMRWSGAVYLAPFEKTWTSVLVLLHNQGAVWDCIVAQTQSSRGKEYGEHHVTFALHCKAVAINEGIGMFEGFWGAGKAKYNRPVSLENPRHTAEVWFSKL